MITLLCRPHLLLQWVPLLFLLLLFHLEHHLHKTQKQLRVVLIPSWKMRSKLHQQHRLLSDLLLVMVIKYFRLGHQLLQNRPVKVNLLVEDLRLDLPQLIRINMILLSPPQRHRSHLAPDHPQLLLLPRRLRSHLALLPPQLLLCLHHPFPLDNRLKQHHRLHLLFHLVRQLEQHPHKHQR